MQYRFSPARTTCWPTIGAGGIGVNGIDVTVGRNCGCVGDGNGVELGSGVSVGGSTVAVSVGGAGVSEGVLGASVSVALGCWVGVAVAVGCRVLVGGGVSVGVGLATTGRVALPW